jgi:hypothetical protein
MSYAPSGSNRNRKKKKKKKISSLLDSMVCTYLSLEKRPEVTMRT